MKHCILLIILITIIFGCSPSTVLINENYKGQQNKKKDLVILPINYDSLTVFNWDDVVDDFGVDSADCKSFIYDTLSRSILHNSKSHTRNLIIKEGKELINWNAMKKDTSNCFFVKQTINEKYKVEYQIPTKDFFNPYVVDSSYVLIIKTVAIGRNIERQMGSMIYTPGQTINTQGGTFQTPGSFSSGWSPENLGAVTEFIIWDYENNDFVKCGKIVSKVDFVFGMTTEDWIALFKTIPSEIFQDTPFAIPVVNYYLH